MEDKEIIDLYWSRSERAISETQEKYGSRLHLLVKKIVSNDEDSEECVNDTYHAAWCSIPPKRPEYFFAYLAKIARNFAFGVLDYQNAKKRNAIVVNLSEEMEQCIPARDEYERKMDSEAIAKTISSFLYTQPQQMRVVFVRRYWYFDSIAEISKRLHMSESKVKSILFRMRNKLRIYLEEEGISL